MMLSSTQHALYLKCLAFKTENSNDKRKFCRNCWNNKKLQKFKRCKSKGKIKLPKFDRKINLLDSKVIFKECMQRKYHALYHFVI